MPPGPSTGGAKYGLPADNFPEDGGWSQTTANLPIFLRISPLVFQKIGDHEYPPFVSDRADNGGKLRILRVLDEFNGYDRRTLICIWSTGRRTLPPNR